jgi:O-acetyl-ADP-ribose deacetylase (regulator of RNase III)
MKKIVLSDYRDIVHLDEPFIPKGPAVASSGIPHLIDRLLSDLISVKERNFLIEKYGTPRKALYAALISRPALPFPSGYLDALDGLLAYERALIRPFDPRSLPRISEQFPDCPGFLSGRSGALWQGDITELQVDAIVNAANDTLLGCFKPFHACVDNAIHAAAGPRLREDTAIIMSIQGSSEQTGRAKITRAYHLPSRFILHTVGPIFHGNPENIPEDEKALLASSYRACLDLASEVSAIRSIAFCSISTGVFGFPAMPAARIALKTVDQWLLDHPGRFDLVVFNLFSQRDYDIYRNVLAENHRERSIDEKRF